MAEELVIDMSDPTDRRRLWEELRPMRGTHRFKIRQGRTRSSPQNRTYWKFIVGEFQTFLRQQGEFKTLEQCHRMLAFKFLRETVFCEATGEVIGEEIRSTTDLTVAEFSEYMEACVAYLSDTFHVVCRMPDDYSTEAA